jgi:hypothetical protein
MLKIGNDNGSVRAKPVTRKVDQLTGAAAFEDALHGSDNHHRRREQQQDWHQGVMGDWERPPKNPAKSQKVAKATEQRESPPASLQALVLLSLLHRFAPIQLRSPGDYQGKLNSASAKPASQS